jgi:hypothetical protein
MVYDGESAVKDPVGEIDLEGAYDLCGKEPREEGRGRITDFSEFGEV